MSSKWLSYAALLEEAVSLDDVHARLIAEAEAAYAAEGRRMQDAYSRAKREVKALDERNTRVQIGARDLSRAVGVTPPKESLKLAVLSEDELHRVMKSVEYDLVQLNQSVQHFRTQQHQTAARAAPPVQPSPSAAPAMPTVPVRELAPRQRGFAAVWTAVGVLVMALIVLVFLLNK